MAIHPMTKATGVLTYFIKNPLPIQGVKGGLR